VSDRVQKLAETAELVDAIRAAGLVVTRIEPKQCHRSTCWTVALWTPAGGLWMEASHESAMSILDAVALWRDHPDRAVGS
jgi:hypothetical protein